ASTAPGMATPDSHTTPSRSQTTVSIPVGSNARVSSDGSDMDRDRIGVLWQPVAVPRFEPFRALRYAASPLDSLVAPPYDVLSPDDVAGRAGRDGHNSVHVDVREGGDDRHQRAAELLDRWIADGVLVADDDPSFTIYRTRFTDATGAERNLVGVLGA